MTTVYFDGLCHLCSREIEHYRKMKGAENLRFMDITSAEFDAVREGLDPRAVHAELHVRDDEGKVHVGVDAFVKIWSHLAALRWLGPVVAVRPVHWLLEGGYFCFAKVRPFLPRKSCASSPYCDISVRRP